MPRLLTLVVLAASLAAQDALTDDTFPGARRSAAVPAPKAVLGHELGVRHTRGADAIRYARELAAATPRVRVEEFGRSAGDLPLVKAVVTSPANHDRHDSIRAASAAMSDGRTKPPADHPLTLWMGCSIHGDEASGVEAGLALLYHLASDERPETSALLDAAVVCIDLDQNPDGRERFVSGVRDRSSARPQLAPRAWDHAQAWPGGRFNHYGFDMNRDWALQTQPESRARAREVLRDRPQVLLDLHEMDTDATSYFSAPPGPPASPHLTPELKRNLELCGDGIAAAYDGRGWPYWTGDRFPADFPGYGGAWPCFLGIAGFTYEQAGAGAGAVRRNDGSVLTLREVAQRHLLASWAALRAAADRRGELFANQLAHFRRVREEGEADDRPVFVLTPRRDPDRLRRLHATLAGNGIRCSWLRSELSLELRPLGGGASEARTIPAGSLIVSARQPARPLVLALLDPSAEFDREFAQAEEKRLARHDPPELYDVSAWCLPLLFGVEAFRAAALPADAPLAESFEPAVVPIALERPATAWLAPGRDLQSSALLARLLEAGVRVQVATFAFTIAERSFDRGTLVVLADRNRDEGARAAIEREVRAGALRPAGSARTPEGHDLGSARSFAVVPPRIAVAAGPGVAPTSFGAVRWLFEQAVPVPHVCVGLQDDLRRALEDVNVLVLPDGGGYAPHLSKPVLEGFLERGGTIVAIRGAAEALAAKELALLPLKAREKAEELGPLFGAIVAAEVDAEHWLTAGLDEELCVHARARSWWQPVEAKDARTVVRFGTTSQLFRAGFLTAAQKAALAGAPLVLEREQGRGRILAFLEDPAWRGTTPGAWKLLLNACLLGPSQAR